jgi:pimeloyl-ACP methyl ester carboxylesterase
MRLSLLFGLISTVILSAFSANAGNAPTEPVLLGPTTFSTFTENSYNHFGYDLVYLQHDVNPKLRRVGYVYCLSSNFTVTSLIELENYRGEWSSPLPAYSAKTCAEHGPHIASFSETLANTEFDRWDRKVIGQINRTFYKEIEEFGTLSFQHGHPTDKVYVFLPGLYMNAKQFESIAEREFWNGSNVILGTLPGHQNRTVVANENDIGTWLTYTDFLVSVARHYGKKVILVGQSTGGTLAVRAAETGKVDGLILFQPFFGLSKSMTAVLEFGKLLPDFLLNRKVHNQNVLEFLKIGVEDQRLLLGSFQKLPPTISIDLITADDDGIVSTSASLRWAKQYAPQAKITHHPESHMYVDSPSRFSQ